MIGRLRGELITKKPPQLLIEVAGVGYDVECPMSTFYNLPEKGNECILLTHLMIRDDAHILFGFATEIERTLFRALLKVNGIGAKMALAILSGMSPSEFSQCILSADAVTLVRIPGIGKKTAERLIIELKDRMDKLNLSDTADTQSEEAGQSSRVSVNEPFNEAVEALQALGYKPANAEKMVRQIAQPNMNSEALIRQALKSMNS